MVVSPHKPCNSTRICIEEQQAYVENYGLSSLWLRFDSVQYYLLQLVQVRFEQRPPPIFVPMASHVNHHSIRFGHQRNMSNASRHDPLAGRPVAEFRLSSADNSASRRTLALGSNSRDSWRTLFVSSTIIRPVTSFRPASRAHLS